MLVGQHRGQKIRRRVQGIEQGGRHGPRLREEPPGNAVHQAARARHPQGVEQLQGKKLHVLSYLGQTWGQGQPRFPDELVAGYTKLILAQDGILTWDIPLEPNGAIPQAYRRQLQALGRMLEE